jgi:hypothetical protein
MGEFRRILVLSDVHYACEAEAARGEFEIEAVKHPVARAWVTAWMRLIWMRRPGPQNGLLERFLHVAGDADLVVANGDHTVNSAFVGLSDPASLESARICLDKLRRRFGDALCATIGDHELGKNGFAVECGGMRLESFHLARESLGLKPVWRTDLGAYSVIGVTSSLLALSLYEAELRVDEAGEWRRLAREHAEEVVATFRGVAKDRRILLFCHDPSALPFLRELPGIRDEMGRIEATVIGHLHSGSIFEMAGCLAGVPKLPLPGAALRRINAGLNRARVWRAFRTRFCPCLAGIQLLGDGGFLEIELDEEGQTPATFHTHAWKRDW